MSISYLDRVRWNTCGTYGKCVRVKKSWLRKVNLGLAVVITGLYPVPLALFLNKFLIKKDMVMRYGR